MRWLLLSSFLFQSVLGCLRVNHPGCACPAVGLTSGNIQSLVGANPYIENVTSRNYAAAQITQSPTDKCSTNFQCPAGRKLVILDKTDIYTFQDGSVLTGFCDAETQTWFLDDGISESAFITEAYATCVELDSVNTAQPENTTPGNLAPCYCDVPLTNANIESLYPNNTQVKDLTKFVITPATYTLKSQTEELCSYSLITCPTGLTRVLIIDIGFTVYNKTEETLRGLCSNKTLVFQIFNDDWSDITPLIEYIYPNGVLACVDYSTLATTIRVPATTPAPSCVNCKAVGLTMENVNNYTVTANPFIRNLTSYVFSSPEISTDPANTCKTTITCPSNLDLVILDNTRIFQYEKEDNESKKIVTSCDSHGQWLLDDGKGSNVPITELFAACDTHLINIKKCICKPTFPTADSYQELVGNHPFIQNISQYPRLDVPSGVEGNCFYFFHSTSRNGGNGTIVVMDDENKVHVFEGWEIVLADCSVYDEKFHVGTTKTSECSYEACKIKDPIVFTKNIYVFNIDFKPPVTTPKPLPPCICDPLIGISEENRGQHDPNEHLNGWIVPMTMSNQTLNTDVCYQTTIGCPNDLYVFNGAEPGLFNMASADIKCQRNAEQLGQWNFMGHFLTNAAIACVKPAPASSPCSCTPLREIVELNRHNYDPNGEMVGTVIGAPVTNNGYIGHTLCYSASIQCSNTLYLYSPNSTHYALKMDGSSVGGQIKMRCMKPLDGDSYQWFYGTTFVFSPAFACVV